MGSDQGEGQIKRTKSSVAGLPAGNYFILKQNSIPIGIVKKQENAWWKKAIKRSKHLQTQVKEQSSQGRKRSRKRQPRTLSGMQSSLEVKKLVYVYCLAPTQGQSKYGAGRIGKHSPTHTDLPTQGKTS